MPFADLRLTVNLVSQCVGFDLAWPSAKPHGAAQFFHATEFAQLVDDSVVGGRIEFAGIGLRQSANIAGKLNAGCLHAKADSEVGNFVLTGITDGLQHAFYA